MYKKKLSIIVPVYNVEQYVEKCIASLLVPGEDDYEIVIVNDGTKDKSIDIIKGKFTDSRIRILDQENGGLSSARNHGIDVAKGEYIWCVDSDDWVETAEIPTIIKELKDLDILYFGSYYTDYGDGRDSIINILENDASDGKGLICKSFAHCAPYYIIKKQLLDQHNLRFPEGILHEDSLFTPVLLTYCNKVRHYEAPVYHHLKRDGSITHIIKPKRIYDLIYVITSLIEFGKGLDKDIKYNWGRCIAESTNSLLFITLNCNDNYAKMATKKFVNNNKEILSYLAHSGMKNKVLTYLSILLGQKLYTAYSLLYKIRYK